MNWKAAFLAFAIHCSISLLFPNASQAQDAQVQEAQRDPAQASVSLRGIVSDEQGKPIVGASVEAIRYDGTVTSQTKSIEGGAFILRLPNDSYQGTTLLIQDESKQLASVILGYSYNLAESKNVFRVVLKPLRETTVTVVDHDGKPLADATVRLYVEFTKWLDSQTNELGQVKFKFPADAKVDWVVAYKSGHGFDYHENYDTFPTMARLDLPSEVKLKLDGFTTVKVKIVDTKNQPVVGVSVTPWTIQKTGKLDDANLSGDGLGKTDANGVATFDWIPSDLVGHVTFLVREDQFHCPNTPSYSSGGATDLETTVWNLCTVKGKVRHADGTPAAGIRLQGEGRGATNHYYRGYASTKSDGTFEMKIYPDQDTIIAITDEKFAAPSTVGINLKEGEVLDNVQFELNKGFTVGGLFTKGEKRTPVSKETATLIQQGPNGSQLVRWSESDKNGRYRFRVGPGDYQLRLLDDKMMSITVKDEDLVFDSHVERLARGMFTGKVVDQTGKPLKAEIHGESINEPGHAGLVFKSTEDGAFATERWNDQMRLLAFDPVNRLAATLQIEADTESTTFELAPAASLRGSVKDERGTPLKNVAVTATSNALGGIRLSTLTDAEGNFSFPAVTTKMNWSVTASTQESSNSKDVDAQEAKEYQVEPFTVPAK